MRIHSYFIDLEGPARLNKEEAADLLMVEKWEQFEEVARLTKKDRGQK